MIELRELCKSYKTGDFIQKALDGVSISFRDSEFVAVLGPSGSGKTTLLNVLGGLDHADSGDIVVNGVSTKRYRSKDWDTYRNHRIGFIFQSYNLIPHQSVLSNVELALTLSGVGRAERKRRALDALDAVGLADHVHKKPGQLSGGQMQRVAIARALVNNPDIVLADEPTGALDTQTGIQVMEVLRQVARDRLVVMVTHNPELAQQYATRIVNLRDGRIVGDSAPVAPASGHQAQEPGVGVAAAAAAVAETAAPKPAYGAPAAAGEAFSDGSAAGDTAAQPAVGAGAGKGPKTKRARMSFLTALGLSFSNLMTKKGRTFLTSFAGSIGIMGIAAILAVSTGVNNYIAKTEQDALSAYPLTITKSSFDMTNLLSATASYGSGDGGSEPQEVASEQNPDTKTYLISQNTIMNDMFAKVKSNDLSSFKQYLDSPQSGIEPYVSAIQYTYGITPQVYETDTSNGPVQLNPGQISSVMQNGISGSALSTTGGGMNSFSEMIDNSDLLDDQMEVVDGRWPHSYDEAVLVLSSDGQISDYTLYNLGVYDPARMKDMANEALEGNEVEVPEADTQFTYEDAMNLTFKVVPAVNKYQYNASQGTWTDMSNDDDYLVQQINDGIELKVVGIVKPKETTQTSALSEGIAYTPGLIDHLMEVAGESQIVQDQIANPDVDVFTGKTFDELSDEQGGQLDMGSLFTIDENALASAFRFDGSALSGAGSNMDLSSIQLDTSALSSVFNEQTMGQVLAGAPQPDFSSISPDLDSTEVQAASGKVVGGFMAYLMAQHVDMSDGAAVGAAWQTYMTTPAAQGGGQEAVAQLAEVLGGAYSEQMQEAMNDYMTNQFTPYLETAMSQLMQQAMSAMASQLATAIQTQLASSMTGLADSMQGALTVDTDAFANAFQFNMTQDDLTSLLTNYMNADQLTYDGNMKKLGYAQKDNPETISIYPIDFPSKEQVISIIDRYNDEMEAAGQDDRTIAYSDLMGTLMRSVTDIVDRITMVLIAFVAISLVVSSIMIAIITYISVLERKKEIGILRAMGASKLNVANIFNAETIIEGLISGVMAIIVVLLVSIPVNAFVMSGYQIENVMTLPPADAFILIGISVLLTFVAGLIPSMAAARRDPVEALRSE